MKHVVFMSRADAAKYHPLDATAFISITEPGFSLATLNVTPNLKATLCLKFHDADPGGTCRIFDGMLFPVYFDDAMADEVLNFVDKYKHEVDTFAVHCEGGISRSAAVAKWIADEYVLPASRQFEGYSVYNKHVYAKLRAAAFRRLYGDDNYLIFEPK